MDNPYRSTSDSAIRRTPGRRILVVDDNRDAASSLAMLLKIMGNESRTAFDGAEALEIAEEFLPDAILLDLGMPKLNGFDACRQMRATDWGRGIVIVALTGWGQDEDKRRSKEAGFDDHFVKPVEPASIRTLLEAIDRADLDLCK